MFTFTHGERLGHKMLNIKLLYAFKHGSTRKNIYYLFHFSVQNKVWKIEIFLHSFTVNTQINGRSERVIDGTGRHCCFSARTKQKWWCLCFMLLRVCFVFLLKKFKTKIKQNSVSEIKCNYLVLSSKFVQKVPRTLGAGWFRFSVYFWIISSHWLKLQVTINNYRSAPTPSDWKKPLVKLIRLTKINSLN